MKTIPLSPLNQLAQVDANAIEPFPNSKKIYVQGSKSSIQVPMREIAVSSTITSAEPEPNPSVIVYDTSGVYTDPNINIDICKGLPDIRSSWIDERQATEQLSQLSSNFTQQQLANPELQAMRFGLTRLPSKAKAGHNVTQMHYAKKGIVTDEMEFVAIRENLKLEAQLEAGIYNQQHAGNSFGASIPKKSPLNLCDKR